MSDRNQNTPTLRLVVVTGMSGAGRSTALRVMDDVGYFCVDNLPPKLALDLVHMLEGDGIISRVALGVDVRTVGFLEGAETMFSVLRNRGHDVQVLFLDAADATLLHRYSESRRPHPLSEDGDVLSAVQSERERLGFIRKEATRVIDTTKLSVHDLRRSLLDHLSQSASTPSMIVRLLSFGFKYGTPADADVVLDVRHLPNPHFEPELKSQSGLDAPVSQYVLAAEDTQALIQHWHPLVEHLLPRYEREGKSYLTIAVGCTGGRHRSVTLIEHLAKHLRTQLQQAPPNLTVTHRDLAR